MTLDMRLWSESKSRLRPRLVGEREIVWGKRRAGDLVRK